MKGNGHDRSRRVLQAPETVTCEFAQQARMGQVSTILQALQKPVYGEGVQKRDLCPLESRFSGDA
ncbi:MAG: hypothetical protein JSW21_06335 [Gammaproteobacteria bacterium]|nr:MAG: hypothetical protein JSW21_06335 [Gammaproteobacteria bacterium]